MSVERQIVASEMLDISYLTGKCIDVICFENAGRMSERVSESKKKKCQNGKKGRKKKQKKLREAEEGKPSTRISRVKSAYLVRCRVFFHLKLIATDKLHTRSFNEYCVFFF